MPSGKEIGRGLDLPQLQYGTVWSILFKKFVKFAKQMSEYVVGSDEQFLAFGSHDLSYILEFMIDYTGTPQIVRFLRTLGTVLLRKLY